jgi:hypothetical protein
MLAPISIGPHVKFGEVCLGAAFGRQAKLASGLVGPICKSSRACGSGSGGTGFPSSASSARRIAISANIIGAVIGRLYQHRR